MGLSWRIGKNQRLVCNPGPKARVYRALAPDDRDRESVVLQRVEGDRELERIRFRGGHAEVLAPGVTARLAPGGHSLLILSGEVTFTHVDALEGGRSPQAQQGRCRSRPAA